MVYILLILFTLFCCQADTVIVCNQPEEEQQEEIVELLEEPVVAWLELPGWQDTQSVHILNTVYASAEDGEAARNYTYLYDYEHNASYWVAYPLYTSTMGTGRAESWQYDPEVDRSLQTSVKSGYGSKFATANYGSNFYARGHQIPNADRNAREDMMAQTYYSTNMTPQIQNGFNAGIWAKLEDAVRTAVPPGDTLYVVTGAAFRTVGGNEEIKQITNKNDNKTLDVPNYYYKVLLKVQRNADGVPTSAMSIGFWLPHEDLKNREFTEFVTTVDQIEILTGFDFFPGLPDTIENAVESASTAWSEFKSWLTVQPQ